MTSRVEELRTRGRTWLRNVLDDERVDTLGAFSDVGDRPGARIDMASPVAKLLVRDNPLTELLQRLGLHPAPVRLVAFNKTAEANWSVPWHQDRVIAVAKRNPVDGYSNWVSKDGFWHCEPPLTLLQRMVFVRIHLDSSLATNGPLQLALGSHRHGKIRAEEASTVAEKYPVETCEAAVGDVLVVHALTLHRSSSASDAASRRTLRVDYAPRAALNDKLEWAYPA